MSLACSHCVKHKERLVGFCWPAYYSLDYYSAGVCGGAPAVGTVVGPSRHLCIQSRHSGFDVPLFFFLWTVDFKVLSLGQHKIHSYCREILLFCHADTTPP